MSKCLLRNAVFVCGLLFCAAGYAQSPSNQPAPQHQADGRVTAHRRAATLTRGINTSGWFGGSNDYSPKRTSTYITVADLSALHAMGIQYIRFPFDPAFLTQSGSLASDNVQLWKQLDDALDMVQRAGFAIDFVVFPTDDYKQRLSTQGGIDQFVLLWQILARHFAGRDPDRFFLELMNESKVQDSQKWVGIETAAVKAIRQIDKRHTILASGANFDNLLDLLNTEALPDPNVIYTFHFYEPEAFTNQGATWATSELLYYKNIPYPSTPQSLAQILKSIPDDSARYKLYLYAAAGWNRAEISRRLAFAADWGREHHVPVICNEFGAYRDTAPADSRTRYLEDVRIGLEKHRIGWAMWDWNGTFSLVTRENGENVPDAADVQALGLKLIQ